MAESLRALFGELLLILFEFFPVGQCALENVLFEEAGLAHAILEDHKPNAMLQSLFPVSSVNCAIVPVHFTVADLDVVCIVSFVFTA